MSGNCEKVVEVLKQLCRDEIELDTSGDDAQRDPNDSQKVNAKQCLTNLKEIADLIANLCETIRMREYVGHELEEINSVLLRVHGRLELFFCD